MTAITIYPFFGDVNLENLRLYALDNGLTITATETTTSNTDGTRSAKITVSEILTAGQKTIITDLFSGTAYIKFS